MLKKDMVDTIVMALYNVNEITGPVMLRTHRGYSRWSKEDLKSEYNKAREILMEKAVANLARGKALAEKATAKWEAKVYKKLHAYKDAISSSHAATGTTVQAEKGEAKVKRNRPYKALDNKGGYLITVYARNAYLARGEVLDHLISYCRDTWREGHYTLLTDTGIKLYWCHSMGKYVTIPDGGDNA